ncbi:molybdopterin-dependent oxidoreductase [Thermobifida halotolerans]|uniref:Molybdopterin-dependent oxidoreductase n=1 Tax=Thermobifida halotolerans TaxID=483545 RepID=A0A399G0D0_9ACTN|nr:molybdopterin-dependent oxidoreductase [Thermobifida halotolerans]UOE20152.1 molybdopterin-dependent oxidoreductase [Thermobifida halotolerans]
MSERRLPPGQYVPSGWPAVHYGPVPRFRPQRWDLRVYGATAGAGQYRWDWTEFEELPRVDVVADFHCVTRFTITDVRWRGVAAATLVELAPPAEDATHVMVWAEYGYSANLRMDDFLRPDVLLATHRDGERLSPKHGHPVRLVVPHLYGWKSVKWVRAIEYLTVDRRGFWEERGYHNVADPWAEQRYSYQEEPGEGPPLD